MYKSIVSTILVYFFILNCSYSQIDLSVANIPNSLKEGANKVVRFNQTIFEIQGIGKGVYTTNYAITILNQKGRGAANVSIYYSDLLSLKNIDAAVYDAGGNLIKKLKKSEIRDYSYYDGISILTDSRLKNFDLRQSQYPYTIEVSYEQTYDGLMTLPSWVAQRTNKTSVQNANFVVRTPLDYQLKTKTIGLEGAIIKKDANSKSYSWSLQNATVEEREYLSADPSNNSKIVELAPTKFEMEGYTGDLSTWSSYGRWFNKLMKGREELSPEKALEFKQLIEGVTDKEEQIKIIYNYLQENTRYVSIQLGIGGWQPFTAAYVDEKGFGDCKALTNYTKVALKSIGISSYYTLVNAGKDEDEIDPLFPSNQFNHAFLCVPNEQDTIWLECTSQTNPFGYLGNFTSDRDVLILNEKGGEIVHTPSYNIEENTYKTTGSIKLDIDGNANAKLVSTFSGLSYEYVSGFDMEGAKQKNKSIKDLFPFKGMEINDFEFEQQKRKIPTASLTIDITARKMATVSGKRFFLVPNQINQNGFKPPKYEDRNTDFKIRYDKNTVDSIVYEVPESIHPEFVPKPKVINTDFGTYETKFEEGPGVLKYYRKFTLNKGVYDKATYSEYVKFREDCRKADKQKVVFLKST